MAVIDTPDDVTLTAAAPNGSKSGSTESIGRPGLRNYYYWVIVNYPIGSVISESMMVRGAPDQLNAANYVAVSWEAAPKSLTYDLLRTDTPQFPKKSGNYAVVKAITNTYFRDQGGTLDSYDLGGLKTGAPARCLIHLNNRDYAQPVLEMPCAIKVSTVIFADGTSQDSAAGGGTAPILIGGPGITITTNVGPPPSTTINTDIVGGGFQTPWLSNIDGAQFDLLNVRRINVTDSYFLNGILMAQAGSVDLNNIKNISGETGQPVTITSNTVVTGNINITGTTPQYQVNGVPLITGLAIQHGGTAVATQPAINLTDTATATFTVANDAGNNRVNISVTSLALADPTTTLGDLIVRGAAAPATRLGVGTNGQVLTADSAETLGMHWVTPAVTAPAGSSGQIQFNGGGTPNVFAASANLHWDNTNSRLGVNTATPLFALHVAGDMNISSVTSGEPAYRINGVVLASHVGTTNTFALTNIATINGTAPGAIPLTTKGDLFGFSTVGARIPVGADNQVLIADDAVALGVRWVAYTANLVNLNPDINTWGNVQNAISAINTTITTLSRGMAYVGSYDAQNNVATFVTAMSIAPGPLPPATTAGIHAGDYLVVTSNASTGPLGVLNIGDQIISDGTNWNRLAIGHVLATTTADMVPLNPVLGTWNTVQTALAALATTHANAVLTTGSYADPAWITSLAWSKISGVPAGISGPAGAIGQIQFNAGGTPNIFGASANLFWDSANGRLGVHEPAPAFSVDIDGDLNVTGSIYVDSVEFASPGSAHLHATSIGGLAGAPLQITGDVNFESKDRSVSFLQLLDRLDYLEQKLAHLSATTVQVWGL